MKAELIPTRYKGGSHLAAHPAPSFVNSDNDSYRPAYFDRFDQRWVEETVNIYRAHIDKTYGELKYCLAAPRFNKIPKDKYQTVTQVLDRYFLKPFKNKPKPSEIRRQVFTAAARAFNERVYSAEWRQDIFAESAALLDIAPDIVPDRLFADIKNERRLYPPRELPDFSELRLKLNLAALQRHCFHAEYILIDVCGNARALIRQAKWCGLILEVHKGRLGFESLIRISGPLTIIKNTKIYGGAMANLLPFLAMCTKFSALLSINKKDIRSRIVLTSDDPIFPKDDFATFDSKIEQTFSDEFLAATADWHLVREPNPISIGTQLIFPDFLIQHKLLDQQNWYLEIVGFWTEEYIASKIQKYQAANIERLIICINDKWKDRSKELPKNARVIFYKKSIDATAVLNIIQLGV